MRVGILLALAEFFLDVSFVSYCTSTTVNSRSVEYISHPLLTRIVIVDNFVNKFKIITRHKKGKNSYQFLLIQAQNVGPLHKGNLQYDCIIFANRSGKASSFDSTSKHQLCIFFIQLNMKGNFVLILSVCLGALAANTSRPGVKRSSRVSDKTDGKVSVYQRCNSGSTTAEISSLKKEVEAMKKELTQRLNKKDRKGKRYFMFYFGLANRRRFLQNI